MVYKFLIVYLILVNVTGAVMIAADKRKARRNQWRIPERSLLFAAILGGSPGVWFAMRFFHHKTRHAKFTVGVPVIFFLQVVAGFLANQHLF